jgi:small subunit ribosomal protein S16
MPAKIRLTRHGKKDQVFFHLVVADGRAPRDGKFIEKLGTYNPRTNPATIDFNFDRALYWIQKGVQPTDTAKAILSHKGVMFKDHLLRGVAKKALTVEQAEAKFSKWLSDKTAKAESTISKLSDSKQAAYKKATENEAAAREAKAAKIAAKLAAAAAAAQPVVTEATNPEQSSNPESAQPEAVAGTDAPQA